MGIIVSGIGIVGAAGVCEPDGLLLHHGNGTVEPLALELDAGDQGLHPETFVIGGRNQRVDAEGKTQNQQERNDYGQNFSPYRMHAPLSVF